VGDRAKLNLIRNLYMFFSIEENGFRWPWIILKVITAVVNFLSMILEYVASIHGELIIIVSDITITSVVTECKDC